MPISPIGLFEVQVYCEVFYGQAELRQDQSYLFPGRPVTETQGLTQDELAVV